jgi:hypothetical protein
LPSTQFITEFARFADDRAGLPQNITALQQNPIGREIELKHAAAMTAPTKSDGVTVAGKA